MEHLISPDHHVDPDGPFGRSGDHAVPPAKRDAGIDEQVHTGDDDRQHRRENQRDRHEVNERVNPRRRVRGTLLVLGDPFPLKEPVGNEVREHAPDKEIGRV